ncbi:MAG TPA: CapA family protein [bacterium]|nr:CapA family protein [bacterium]
MRRGLIVGLAVLIAALAGRGEMEKKPAVLIAGGDLMFDRGVKERMEKGGGPDEVLAGIAPLLRGADVAIANLECPLTARAVPVLKRYSFRSDPGDAAALKKAGFTALNLANNHTSDYGRAGLMDTARFLEKEGILVVGAGENQEQAARARYVKVGGTTIALLGFVDMPLEGLMPMPDLPGPAMANLERVTAAIQEARARADAVVVTVHWGAEYQRRPTPRQRALAAAMARAGADLIVGHHPHVIQTIEMIGDTAVFYSVGNLVFDQTRPDCTEALLVMMSLTEGGDRTIGAVPIRIVACRPRPAVVEEAREIMDHVAEFSPTVRLQPGSHGWRVLPGPARP